MAQLEELSQALINGNAPKVKELAQAAIDAGVAPATVLSDGLIVGMNEVGRRFKNNEFYVPEVLIAARAMHSGMSVIKPLLSETDTAGAGTILVGTVKGDLHDIGKNLVIMMLEGAGFNVVDMGVDVPPEKFLEAVRDQKPQIVGLSALLTTTMPAMKSTIEALHEAGVRDSVKVLIGGAPVTQRYADEIGADGYAPDAASAVDVARSLIGK
jgi:5-methyltetrahydrofolate--homocysteine methyltransferase